ncbi:hypothetical protein ACSSS7_006394 [Eimeria intestinalis]
MLVKQAAKVQIPSHIMREISPSNLESIIREAELEEEEESRSRNAAFIAAAAAVETTAGGAAAASNPLAMIEDEDEEGSLHRVVAGGPVNTGTGKSSACSTPREKAEEMVLIRSSSPANPAGGMGPSCGVSTAKPWFFSTQDDRRPLSSRDETPRDSRKLETTSCMQEAPSSAAPACNAVAARLTRAESISNASEVKAEGGVEEEGGCSSRGEKHFFTEGENRWLGNVESPLTRGGTTSSLDAPTGASTRMHADADDAGHSTPPQEQESEDDGYELVEISNAERASNPALLRSGQDVAAGSRASSAFAEEREGAGEREGSFMDAIAKLWLAGR